MYKIKNGFITFDSTLYNYKSSLNIEKVYYVYVYMDPRVEGFYFWNDYVFPYEPFYVGKGKNNRLYQHELDAIKTKVENKRLNKIRDIYKEGEKPLIFRVTDFLNEEEAYYIESDLIKCLSQYHCLTNILKGFDGSRHLSTKEYSKIMSEAGKIAHRNNPDRARKQGLKIMGELNGRYKKGYLTSGRKNGMYKDVDVSKIIELYELNFSCSQIGKILNVSCQIPKSRLKNINYIKTNKKRSTSKDSTNRNLLINLFS